MTQIARRDPVEDLLAIATDFSAVARRRNPLRLKGVGEGRHGRDPDSDECDPRRIGPARRYDVPMPATPLRVWRAIRQRG